MKELFGVCDSLMPLMGNVDDNLPQCLRHKNMMSTEQEIVIGSGGDLCNRLRSLSQLPLSKA